MSLAVQDTQKSILSQITKLILKKSNKDFVVHNKVLGDVILPYGTFGDIRNPLKPKGGYGLEHIIQKRHEQNKLNLEELCGLCLTIVEGTINGDVISFNKSKAIIEYRSVAIIVKENWDNDRREWIVSGYPITKRNEIKKEAMDTIHTVNAKYSYLPGYSSFRNQVGAIVSSINNIRHAFNKIKETEQPKKESEIEEECSLEDEEMEL